MRDLITTYTFVVKTAGTAGNATGYKTIDRINGRIVGIIADYHASTPASTHLVVTTTNPAQTILTLADTATDVNVPLRIQCKDVSGNAITGFYDMFSIDGSATVTLTNADALDVAATVYIQVMNPQ